MASTMYAEGLFIQNRVKWDLICYSCDDVLGWVIIDLPPALNLASWLADWLDGDSLGRAKNQFADKCDSNLLRFLNSQTVQ